MSEEIDTAIYIGRFQPFHNGHYNAVRAIWKKHERVIVCIGSAQESYTSKNPWSASERYEMIERALKQCSLAREVIITILDDIHVNALWVSHVVSHNPVFQTVYTNNRLTATLFKLAKFKVRNVPVEGSMVESATKIRSYMEMGMDWKEYVPEAVSDYLYDNKLWYRVGSETTE